MNSVSHLFDGSRCLVVKIGSSLLLGSGGRPRDRWLSTLARDIAGLRGEGKRVVVVTSGAVRLGRRILRCGENELGTEQKKAAAACGQIALYSAWAKAFRTGTANRLCPAQILLTLDDSEDRSRYLNARSTLKTLLDTPNVVPVVNENDCVSTEEMRVGDNDRLAARVAQMMGSDLLVLLSDVDGLYTANPFEDGSAEFVFEVREITPDIDAMASGSRSALASGGMRTKIEAAGIAVAAGCHTIIGNGHGRHPLKRLMDGERCTRFQAGCNPKSARKGWISGSLCARGSYLVDEGALAALMNGKSLLPAGVRVVEGAFERGDAVLIKDLRGRTVGKGLSEYSSTHAERIIAAKSSEIERIIGFKYRDTIVHRDDMALSVKPGDL